MELGRELNSVGLDERRGCVGPDTTRRGGLHLDSDEE